MTTVELVINGSSLEVKVQPGASLLAVLRERMDLTGTKYGCGEGQCGACTVLLDGSAVRSCITPIESAAGKQITTIEGLAKGEKLHPLQETFLEEDAFQCGYCTPGMILSAVALLHRNPAPTRQEIVHAMQGNVCRCGTYLRIVTAIEKAADRLENT